MVFPYPQNITGIMELVNFTNSYTGYMVGPVVLLCTFAVSFMSMIISGGRTRDEFVSSLVTSLWITTLTSALLSMLPNMINIDITIFLMVGTVLSTVFLFRSQ